MNFSEVFRSTSNPLPSFSPDGKFLASSDQHRLTIREVQSSSILQLYPCIDRIDSIIWSPDSIHILTMIKSRGFVHVWSAIDSDWDCKIDEGQAGVQSALWSPDGLSIIILASHGIRTTAWSLLHHTCSRLNPCKTDSLLQGVAFSPDGGYMAQLERTQLLDRVSIYETQSWSKVTELSTASPKARTFNAVSISWSPNGSFIAVCDDSLQYKILIYDALNALTHVFPSSLAPLASYSSSSSSSPALPIFVYTSKASALGIRTTAWDSSGNFIAIGSYDDRIRVLNDINWQPLVDYDHPLLIPQAPDASTSQSMASLAIYNEVTRGLGKSGYEIIAPPFSLRKAPSPPPHSKFGVDRIRWDPKGWLIATTSGGSPCVVWIHDFSNGGEPLAILQHESPIKAIEWRPRQDGSAGSSSSQDSMLAIVTEGIRSNESCARAFIWQPAGATVVEVPTRVVFQVESVAWSPLSDAFALIGAEGTCIAYLPSKAIHVAS